MKNHSARQIDRTSYSTPAETAPADDVFEPFFCEFQYPCEVEQLLRDHQIRGLLDEFIQKQMFANLAQTINRILNRIIESDNAKAEAIVIAWAIGIRDERTESSEATLKSLSRIDVRRTRSWLVKKKADVLQVLAK